MTDNQIKTKSLNLANDIKKVKKIGIVTHKNPDGDAIGSALGMKHFLKALNKEVNVFVSNNLPDFLTWMPEASDIYIFDNDEKQSTELFNSSEMIICVDFNTPERAGKLENLIKNIGVPTVIIDHHPMPDSMFTHSFSDTAVSSASELVYKVISAIDKPKIDNKSATCIYTGMITDTGNFSHNCSSPAFYRTIAELLELKIDRNKIYEKIYNTFTESRIRLMGFSLNKKMNVIADKNTAIIALSKEELERFEYKMGDTEGFVNLPFSIENIIFSVLLLEKDHYIKMSFRSKGSFDVNILARKYFSGGGHKNAAGGRSFISLEETLTKLNEIINSYKNELNTTI